VVIGVVYLAVASQGTFAFRASAYPYHVYVADAWIHGQLNIRDEILQQRADQLSQRYRATVEQQYAAHGQHLTEEHWQSIRAGLTSAATLDLSQVDGRWYAYWPPMTSALLVPYVAVVGAAASDVLFSCVVGTGTVLLVFMMLRQAYRARLMPMTPAATTALTLLFGLGTVHFYLVVTAQVWFLSQVVATFFCTMAVWFVFQADQGWGWIAAAGSALGAAFLARNTVVFMAPFFYLTLFALWERGPEHRLRSLIGGAASFSVPLVVAGVINLAFNYARFGSAFDSGWTAAVITGGNNSLKEDFLHHGVFSLHYLSRNAYYYLLNLRLRTAPRTGTLTFDPMGNSAFLVTPALLYLFRSGRHFGWFTAGLWTGGGSFLLMLLLFFTTGWSQFGNRYLLELMPLATVLIAIGMKGRLTRVSIVLIGLSIAVNAWGTYRFCVELG
jgi:4-amino-4-deoxy-L-arabinose transferase-like glycosyltransferase